jgi:tRNA (cytidine56-2'-O)-methyltransferase
MRETPELAVLRLGHRPGRDERMTTHVGLTARALGADRLLLTEAAAGRRESVVSVTNRFGGPFDVEITDDPERLLDGWSGTVVHLTMYGLPLQDVEGEIRAQFDPPKPDDEGQSDGRDRSHTVPGDGDGRPLLVVVGAEKVPFEVYEVADWNVAVTNQPHSEVASLAVFLDRLFEGRELGREFDDPERVVVPRAEGKHVEDA